MCGIAGIVGQGSGASFVDRVRHMTAALTHRGPDGEGFHNAASVALGHRRLAIIDLESGKQPISNEDESIWLTFNGEIYNYRDLHAELATRGHEFKTKSDSEVIVHAYEEWGPDCVQRFRGMFAFGIVDQKRRRLTLARDQLGIKPLCYRVDNDAVAFASELPALLQSCVEWPATNLQALEYFLRYRYIPAPDTAYQGIHKLPPATYQVYDFHGNLLTEREYWRFEFDADEHRSPEQALEEFEHALMDSVQAHLVADVPFGAFLSGGVDSTLVVACMAKLLGKEVRAFTIDFEEENYSERKFATEAAAQLGIELRHEVVRPDVVDTLERLFTNYGEPFADTSAVPTWWVAELARRDVPMVLSGDGADEAFAGYGRYARWIGDSVWSDASNFIKYPKRLSRRLADSFRQRFTNLRLRRWEQHFVGMLQRSLREQMWQSEYQSVVDNPCPAFAKAGREAAQSDKLSFAQYIDIKTYLPGDILTKVDIASMQHGLEVRTPFTDVRMLEFAAKLPTNHRYDGSFKHRDGSVGRLKSLPKQALGRSFSDAFVDRKKMGFAIPEGAWMRRGNPVRKCFDDLLASPNSQLFDFFQKSTIDNMRKEFDQRGLHATALWSVFALSFWMDRTSADATQRKAA